MMENSQRSSQGPSLGDVLYSVFRHKGLIMVLSAVSLVAAFFLRLKTPKIYESEAKLLIKYVIQATAPSGRGAEKVQDVDDRGENILSTELQILTSRDLALQVVDSIGAQKILAKAGGGDDREQAANLINDPKNLLTEVPKKSNVIRIAFRHPDSAIVQEVLDKLIKCYIKEHAEIWQGGGFDEFLTKETDTLRTRLLETEKELREAKQKAGGVISVAQAQQANSEQIAKLKEKVFDAEADLAEREAALDELTKRQTVPSSGHTNTIENSGFDNAAPDPDKVAEYRRVSRLADALEKKEQDLLIYLTADNAIVKQVDEQLQTNQKLKKQLEEQNPGLVSVKTLEPKIAVSETGTGVLATRPDPISELAMVASLRKRVQMLTNQLEEITKRAATVADAEPLITDLERRKALEESYYTNFSQTLEQAQITEHPGAERVLNINTIQAPTPPARVSSNLRKMMAMVLLGGVGGAFVLAFLLDFYLDPSLKRSVDVKSRLGLPLFMSIPQLNLRRPAELSGHFNGRKLLGNGNLKAKQASDLAKAQDAGTEKEQLEVTLWDSSQPLRPFFAALRDRLITWFEIKKLTHKPKLVAVTSCGNDAGVSTVSAGLAASLSETGEGNVLLIDMNSENGAAHHFYKGDLSCGIDEVLEGDKREQALIQENLYVATERTNSDALPNVLPKRFKNLVPKLKASDFDYIIFDMPPVNDISITPRLARFMDMVLMVVEAEKTASTSAKQASALLMESRAEVGIVLNKTRKYVPQWLQQGT